MLSSHNLSQLLDLIFSLSFILFRVVKGVNETLHLSVSVQLVGGGFRLTSDSVSLIRQNTCEISFTRITLVPLVHISALCFSRFQS